MVQGIYVRASRGAPIVAYAEGPLASEASDGQVRVLCEGWILKGRQGTESDAEIAMRAWRRGGIAAVKELDGFYSVVVVDTNQATLVCDAMATRPQWVYASTGCSATAPTPIWFAEQQLPMSFDRLGFYQTLRLMHGLGTRTLITEVTRNRPLTTYTFHENGSLAVDADHPIEQRVDDSRDVAAAAGEIRDLLADVLSDLFAHPAMSGRRVHLPLTAGMDSRHILAQLRRMDRPPESIRHVYVHAAEYEPVAAMSRGLGHPLHLEHIDELDYDAFHGHWMRTTGGLVHHHQLYLMGVAPRPAESTEHGIIGFDGYLADKLVGFACRPILLHDRYYARATLPLLFSDHRDLEAETRREIDEEYAIWHGAAEFKNGGTDAFNRGPTYTGGIFPILSGLPARGDVQYVAPTAHARAFRFFCETAYSIAGKKRARLHLFRHDFPEEGGYPAEGGSNYIERDALDQPGAGRSLPQVPWKRAFDYVRGLASALKTDPAPETEHAWVRQVDYWKTVTSGVATRSTLAEHELVRGSAMRGMATGQAIGGFMAWTLMGLVSGEVALRTLCRGEASEQVTRDLWPTSR